MAVIDYLLVAACALTGIGLIGWASNEAYAQERTPPGVALAHFLAGLALLVAARFVWWMHSGQ